MHLCMFMSFKVPPKKEREKVIAYMKELGFSNQRIKKLNVFSREYDLIVKAVKFKEFEKLNGARA